MQKKLVDYSKLFKSNKRFIFIEDIKLEEVLYLFSGYVSFIYYEEIINKNTCDELKEIKAHTIFI